MSVLKEIENAMLTMHKEDYGRLTTVHRTLT
jgi:hypothetical protein